MILLEETFNVETVTESVGDKKKTYLQGVFMEAETRNRNGRIYDKKEMEKVVEQINDASKLNHHILGALDHPSTLEIKLEEVSHRLIEAKTHGNQIICKAEVLESTPKGAILKSLLDSDITIGVSSRGSGSVNESSGRVSNFKFVTVDTVATPSCQNAWPETIKEHLDMYSRGDVITDLSEAITHDLMAQKYFEIEMMKFIRQLKQ
jgi:hypothetical protein